MRRCGPPPRDTAATAAGPGRGGRPSTRLSAGPAPRLPSRVLGCLLARLHGSQGPLCWGGRHDVAAPAAVPLPVAADGRSQARRGTPGRDAPGAPLRPLLRGRGGPGRGGAGERVRRGTNRARAAQLRHGLLRRLVGVDELHLVRLGVRQRRRAVPGDDPGADRRGAGTRGRGAPRLRDGGLPRRLGRIRDHAGGADLAVVPGGPRVAGPGTADRPAVRVRGAGLSGGLGGPAVHAGRAAPLGVPRAGRLRAERSVLGRAQRDDALASASHRGAVRPVHHHRARRVHLGGDHRGQVGGGRARRADRAAAAGRRWAADRLLGLVDLLRGPGPRRPHHQPPRLPVGLRPLRRPGLRGGHRRRYRDRRRGRRGPGSHLQPGRGRDGDGPDRDLPGVGLGAARAAVPGGPEALATGRAAGGGRAGPGLHPADGVGGAGGGGGVRRRGGGRRGG
ncbi:integral membrane protein [Streptomyces albidoflavus]|nr:integral membrane protein [Streptomyces albidoflavus]